MHNFKKPVLGFAAFSGTGKTTLLTQLIPLLKQHGLRIAVIKHSHHNFDIDKPGKDSFRLREAGASPVMLVSKYRRAIMTEFPKVTEPCLNTQLKLLAQSPVDLILVEGFKAESFPKIECYRPSLNKPLLYPNDDSIIAIATDNTSLKTPHSLSLLDLNDVNAIAQFILQRFFPTQTTDNCAAKSLLTLEQALIKIKTAINPVIEWEYQAISQSLGRILAENIYSPINLPTDCNSAMDGYALASTDIKPDIFCLPQVGISWAGKPYQHKLQAGECVRLFTGAVLPEGADTVVMQEDVEVNDLQISFTQTIKAGQHVRATGEDIQQGDLLLTAAKKITAVDMGLLASAGVYQVSVKRKLRIAFLSTGDELIGLGKPLISGKIYDSNRYTLMGLLTDSCYSVTDLGVIIDDKTLLTETLATAAQDYDVIISTGGASVGDADYIQQILAEIGDVNFWKIAIKPGKPLAFGKIGNAVFFGLPGNPVSVIATFEQVVKPALRQMIGAKPIKALRLTAKCLSPLKKAVGRQDFQRGFFEQTQASEFTVRSVGLQGSNMLGAMSQANCYIVLPIENSGVNMGEWVIIEPFDHN